MKQIVEGSHAIAQTIKNIKPAVISAYPITPQTHIVEDLAKFKAGDPTKHGWEMEKVEWFNYTEASKLLAFKGEQEALQKSWEQLKSNT